MLFKPTDKRMWAVIHTDTLSVAIVCCCIFEFNGDSRDLGDRTTLLYLLLQNLGMYMYIGLETNAHGVQSEIQKIRVYTCIVPQDNCSRGVTIPGPSMVKFLNPPLDSMEMNLQD